MMKVPKMAKLIGTHNGTFHCDEVVACYMLKKLAEYKDAEILRTRDPEKLATCDIVVDVGAVFDPEKKRFDHHQREFKDTMETLLGMKFKTKLSSAGLIYAHYGKDVLKAVVGGQPEEGQIEILFKKVYEKFMEEIDAIDNGVTITDGDTRYQISTHLSARIGFLNPPWNEEDQSTDGRFRKAMELAGAEFEERVKFYYHSWLPARDIVKQAILDRFKTDKSGSLVLFPSFNGLPWKEHLYDLEAEMGLNVEEGREGGRLLYVLYPDSTAGNWRIQCIPEDQRLLLCQGAFFRKPMPEAWRGVRDEKLDAIIGIEGCIFCHATGFIGGNKTFEGVMNMAKASLAA